MNYDNVPCCICLKMTDPLAGDPGRWPYQFGHVGWNGETFTHCGDCCAQMYEEYMIGREPTPKPEAKL